MDDSIKVADLIATLREASMIKESRIETLENDIARWKGNYQAEKDEHEIDLDRLYNMRKACNGHEAQINHLGKVIANLQKEYKYWSKVAQERLQMITESESDQELISNMQAEIERLKEQLYIADQACEKMEGAKDDIFNQHLELVRKYNHLKADFSASEKQRIQYKAEWDSKQSQTREERSKVGRLEEELKKAYEKVKYWQGLSDQSHEQARDYATKLGKIQKIVVEE